MTDEKILQLILQYKSKDVETKEELWKDGTSM